MSNLKDYFERDAYQPEYCLGDRVIGKWNKIPFVGSVGNDTVLNHITGPQVSIHLDLPIVVDNSIHRVIIVKHKDIKRLKLIG